MYVAWSWLRSTDLATFPKMLHMQFSWWAHFLHLWLSNKAVILFVKWDPARVFIQRTYQNNEFVCLGTVEDAVGADSFPELFVNVVICTAVDKKTIHRRVCLIILLAAAGHYNKTHHRENLWQTSTFKINVCNKNFCANLYKWINSRDIYSI